MSNGEVRRVSRQDIQLVQNLIERCLQLYMDQNEVVATLLNEAKIEPGFTELVWQKLEEENQEFFKAYRLRLMVKRQIIVFNNLLEKQAKMMSQVCSTDVTSIMSFSNEPLPPLSPPPSAHHSTGGGCFVPSGTTTMKSEPMYPSISCSIIPNAFTFTNACLPMSGTDLFSTMGIKAEPGAGAGAYAMGVGSQFEFGSSGGNVLEAHSNSSNSSGVVLNSQQSLDHPLVESSSSFGFLGQIPRNFSLSDLTAHFSQSSDILEYPRSPFMEHGDDAGLDCISEGLSYERFGND